MEKILFIIDPYPLRSTREFGQVYLNFIRFSTVLRHACECTILAPQSYLPNDYKDLLTRQGNLKFFAYEDFPEFASFLSVRSSVWSFSSVSDWKDYAIGDNHFLEI